MGPRRTEILQKELGISTWGQLLEYYPYKYVDRSHIYSIDELQPDMPFVQLKGKILSFEEFSQGPRKKRIVGHFSDGHGVVDLVWFNGTKYVYQQYKVGVEYIVFGKPGVYGGRYQFTHPDIDPVSEVEKLRSSEVESQPLNPSTSPLDPQGRFRSEAEKEPLNVSTSQLLNLGMQPYYITTEKMKNSGLQSRGMEKIMKALLERISLSSGSDVTKGVINETLPPFITGPHHFCSREEALRWVHYPQTPDEMQRARVRLKFEELFYVQLNILRYASDQRRKYRGNMFTKVGDIFNTFYHYHLPFELTGAQKRVMHEIRADMRSGRQMNRLLQGDVGSGKTLVALMSMLIALDNGYQACMMAPTEILAEQHLQTIRDFLGDMPIRVELLTGIVKGKQRTEILRSLHDGSIQIVVGTHALIEDTVQFHRLGIAVIDEQHRFGVAQRAKLWAKSENPPHVLVMTATPIPRTLAMTIYGDLDVSVIDELPPGRKPIQTIHKFDNQQTSLYRGIRQQISYGRQVYIVFPLIKESEKMDLQNLEEGFEALRMAFPEYRLSKVHGKMKPAEKEAEMQRFVSGETQILVATTVIEVGVNVPNASVMVIESAERFGLSQLHQLRGRVGRGAERSYCILMKGNKVSKESQKRLDLLVATENGFELAEEDMKLRGPGDLEGTMQSGLPISLNIASLAKDGLILNDARGYAAHILDLDPMLVSPANASLAAELKKDKYQSRDYSRIS